MSGVACGVPTMRGDPGMACNGSSQQGSNNGGGVGFMSDNSGIGGGGGSHSGPGSLVQDNNNQGLPQPPMECHTNGTNGEAAQPWKLLTHDTAKMNKLGDMVESTASVASKCLVDSLLQQVSQLSDVEKFLLYLKLPVGRPPDIDPLKQPLNPLGSRSEIQLTITWIQTHLEMNSEVSLPKREVYNEYMHYCTINNVKPLSTADFGKVMKQVFPGVRPRRLGQRGASKYCYSGLRKRYTLNPPTLPDLNDNCTKKNIVGVDCAVDDEEIDRASGNLVLEWAEKLCSVKYDTMRDLALHLVQKNYVDNRSVAAYTLLSVADQKHGIFSGGSGGGKHRETQIQLQRKLQEREHIKEQKRKMQEQSPLVNKPSAERPKSRRRSGTSSRNPSGDNMYSNTNGNLNDNKVVQNSGLLNGNGDIIGESLSNGDKNNVERGNGSSNLSNNAGIQGIMTIKQEDELQTSFDSFDSLLDDKLHPNDPTYGNISNIMNIGHSSTNIRKNTNNNVSHFIPDNSNKSIASKGMNMSSPTKKTFVTMPTGVPKNSPKSRYKPIQPKLTDPNSGVGVNPMGSSSTQWTEVINTGADDLSFPRTETIANSMFSGDGNVERVLQTQPSIERQLSDPCNFNFNNNNNHNEEVGEDELRQSIMCDVQKTCQLSELKKLLIEKKLVPTMSDGGACGGGIDHDGLGPSGMPKRVSFQSNQPHMQNFGPVPPSPNTRRKEFNFQPIGCTPDQMQGMSQCSSVDASPFMSPRNTPLQRSRHNSGQTSSTYITPRSTPFTPDQPQIPINHPSESSTPFMSPITTPLYPRSRHNSSQNLRTPYTPTVRSRHSSGAPTFRHAPYTNEDARRGKFRSRHSSGSIPPSPSSAPLSPLVQDSSLHPPHDPLGLASGSMLQRMLNNKQGQQYANTDFRRRHMSAGSTIHYHQPQPPTFPQDVLGQEVCNVMTSQAGPSNMNPNNPSRPQSVPLLQMLNMPTSSHDNFAKSHPNTPMTNQQFVFSSDCCGSSQPSSYAPTPVPSEYNDFTEEYNLEGIDPMLDVNLPNDPGGTNNGLDSIDQAALHHHNIASNTSADLSTLSELSQQVGPPNINPFSAQFNSLDTDAAIPKSVESIIVNNGDIMSSNSCCDPRQQLNGPTTQNIFTANSMLTLNELNSSVRRGLNLDAGSGGLEDFHPTLADLGDQEMFNSLVLDVNKD